MMHPTRKSVDEPPHEWGNKGKKPLIHPHATELEIHEWLRNWRNPPPPKPKPDKLKRDQPLATIMFSGSLYDFDERNGSQGEHRGIVDLPELEALIEKLNALVGDTETSPFLLVSNEKEVRDRYFGFKERASPDNRINGRVDKRYLLSDEEREKRRRRDARQKKKKAK